MPHAEPQPNIYDLNMLPMFAHMLDGAVENTSELLGPIRQAAASTHPVVTDYDVQRHVRLFEDDLKFIAYYGMQLGVWRKLSPSPAQSTEIARLDALLVPLAKNAQEGLTLAKDIQARRHTFEGFMSKSDEELGLEFLLRMMKSS